MAFRCFLKIFLAFHLLGSVLAAPAKDSMSTAQTIIDEEKSPLKDLSKEHSHHHPATVKSAQSDKDALQPSSADISDLQKSSQVLRIMNLLPPESLRLLQMFAAPVVNKSIAVPANILEKAATVSPSEGLHGIGSLKQRAEVSLHEKILTPVSHFVGVSVNKSRDLLPRVFIGHISVPDVASLKHHFLVQQIHTLRKEISAEVLRLKKTLQLLNQVPGIHAVMGHDGSAEKNSKASSQEDAFPVRSLFQNALESHFREPEIKIPDNLMPESSVSGKFKSGVDIPAKVKVADTSKN